MLRDIARSPNIDKDAVKATGEFGVVEFQQNGRRRVWPCRSPIRRTPHSPGHLIDRGFIPTRWCESDSLGNSSMMVGSSISDFYVQALSRRTLAIYPERAPCPAMAYHPHHSELLTRRFFPPVPTMPLKGACRDTNESWPSAARARVVTKQTCMRSPPALRGPRVWTMPATCIGQNK